MASRPGPQELSMLWNTAHPKQCCFPAPAQRLSTGEPLSTWRAALGWEHPLQVSCEKTPASDREMAGLGNWDKNGASTMDEGRLWPGPAVDKISSSIALLGCTRAGTKLVGMGLPWGPGFSEKEREISGMHIEGIGKRYLRPRN